MSQATTTIDHEEIRRWAEERGGRPSVVRTGKGRGGILRFDFGEDDEKLEETSWEEFFQIFDENDLTFLHQDQIGSGQTSRFFKFVSRDSGSGRKEASGRHGRAKRSSSQSARSGSAASASRKAGTSGPRRAATKRASKSSSRSGKSPTARSRSAPSSRSKTSSSNTRSQTTKQSGAGKAKTTRGRKQDRARVAGGQRHEVAYEAKKSGRSSSSVKKAVKRVGTSRKKVDRELRK